MRFLRIPDTYDSRFPEDPVQITIIHPLMLVLARLIRPERLPSSNGRVAGVVPRQRLPFLSRHQLPNGPIEQVATEPKPCTRQDLCRLPFP